MPAGVVARGLRLKLLPPCRDGPVQAAGSVPRDAERSRAAARMAGRLCCAGGPRGRAPEPLARQGGRPPHGVCCAGARAHALPSLASFWPSPPQAAQAAWPTTRAPASRIVMPCSRAVRVRGADAPSRAARLTRALMQVSRYLPSELLARAGLAVEPPHCQVSVPAPATPLIPVSLQDLARMSYLDARPAQATSLSSLSLSRLSSNPASLGQGGQGGASAAAAGGGLTSLAAPSKSKGRVRAHAGFEKNKGPGAAWRGCKKRSTHMLPYRAQAMVHERPWRADCEC